MGKREIGIGEEGIRARPSVPKALEGPLCSSQPRAQGATALDSISNRKAQ
jgi:hypothetical protein